VYPDVHDGKSSRRAAVLAVAAIVSGVAGAWACGARTGLPLNEPGEDAGDATLGCEGGSCDGGEPESDVDATADSFPTSDGGDALSFDGHCAIADASDACVGLECHLTCPTTTISGRVFDPAGLMPLYNAYVYVANGPLAPMTSGPTCESCQAPASGSPLVGATTGPDGHFSIVGAPDGTDIPLVIQIGKWRRRLTLPTVTACATTTVPDGTLRLPRKQHESSPDDNIPLIALTTGCDAVECFLTGRLGIAQSEFTGQTGSGRVHVYKSANDDGQSFSGITPGSADELWATPGEMMKYDIVFDACECSTYDRGGAGSTNVGYTNFLDYLNAGGRAFTTHYFYNFFADEKECDQGSFGADPTCQGQGALPTVGEWRGNQNLPFSPGTDCPNDSTLTVSSGGPGSCLQIDTAIPKGAAFAKWYGAHNGSLAYGGGEASGYVGLTDIRMDMGQLESKLVAAGTATPWLYAGSLSSGFDTYYVGFNAPVGTVSKAQCGRAIFSDVHVAGSGGGSGNGETVPASSFPSYCAADPAKSDHAPNQLALEFLFFDLFSCVQDETMPPVPPSPQCN
jgi:hypothetical protein